MPPPLPSQPSALLKLGMVDYLNAMPVYDAILRQSVPIPAVLERGTPAFLNQKIAAKKLDISVVSSFEYIQNPEHYYLLPDLSISAKGSVGSILLFSKKPWKQIQGKIYLSSHSYTSIHLAQYLLRTHSVEYLFAEPSSEILDAKLLIGNEALQALQKNLQKPLFPYVSDLGACWYQETQLPFVFAVWVVRRSVFEESPELVWDIAKALLHSKALSKSQYERIAQEHYSGLFQNPKEALSYLKALNYNFSEDLQQALLHFQQACLSMGFLNKIAPLNFIPALP